MNKLPYFFSLIVLLSALFSSPTAQAQWSPQAKGAVIGAGSGAILGAVINKRNRAVGGVVGGVVGGGVGYAIGKHKDNKNKRAARIAAANRAEAARQAQYRSTAAHQPTRTNTNSRETGVAANSLTAARPAMALTAQGNPIPNPVNPAFLPNDSFGDASKPYSTSESRRKSW